MIKEDKSPIQAFYSRQTIFITGGLGFLGKLIIEKLLRTCYDIEKIFLLVRPKKGKAERERLSKEFEKEFFQKVAEAHPDFMSKLEIVPGDLTQPNLGLKRSDVEMLKNRVNIIFHVAATTNFNAKLKDATNINVRATADLVQLAIDMKYLKAFVHVSTAFAHCMNREVYEEIPVTKLTARNLMAVCEALDDQMLDSVTPQLLGENPNTYVLTKALAEEVLQDMGKALPIAIVRPSIVLTTFKEPLPGWTDNIYGAVGVAVGVGMGVIRSLHGQESNIADMVPADMVVNSIIAACWDIGQSSINNNSEVIHDNLLYNGYKDMAVYNYVSSPQNPITWGRFQNTLQDIGPKYGSTKVIWYHGVFKLRSNLYWHNFCIFFLHTVPAYGIDMVRFLMGKKPLAVKGYKKIETFLEVISYFAMRQWRFKNSNVRELFRKMSPEDQNMFNFDIASMDWAEMLEGALIGGRVYLLKDPLDTIPAGRRKVKILQYVHYTIASVLVFLFIKFIFWGFRIIFNV